jgi:hypothetical protein
MGRSEIIRFEIVSLLALLGFGAEKRSSSSSNRSSFDCYPDTSFICIDSVQIPHPIHHHSIAIIQ